MFLSVHRLTCFWLNHSSEGGREKGLDESASQSLALLQSLCSTTVPGWSIAGGIGVGYDPQALPSGSGYDWLKARLLELERDEYRRPGEAPFDLIPEFDHPAPESDPFPALVWEMKSEDGREEALLEVLVGRDYLVFHQQVLDVGRGAESEEKGCEQRARTMTELDWFKIPRVEGPLLQAELYMGWSGQLEETGEDAGDAIQRLLQGYEYHSEIAHRMSSTQYDFHLALSGPVRGDVIRGGLRLRRVSTEEQAGSRSPIQIYKNGIFVLVRLASALVNREKIEFEYTQAPELFGNLERNLDRYSVTVQKERRAREGSLQGPLTHAEVERWYRREAQLRKTLAEEVDQLVSTCQVNLQQFEDFWGEMQALEGPEAQHSQSWVRFSRFRLRYLYSQLESRRNELHNQTAGLLAEIDLLLRQGTRSFSAEYARELIGFPRVDVAAPEDEEELYRRLLVQGAGGAGATKPGCVTMWCTEDARVEGQQQRRLRVLRPRRARPESYEELVEHYKSGLGKCFPDEVEFLFGLLTTDSSRISLLRSGEEASALPAVSSSLSTASLLRFSRPVQTLRKEDGRKVLAALLPPVKDEPRKRQPYCAASFEELSDEGEQDEWVALLCMTAFFDALARFLEDPPQRLATLAEERIWGLPRLLFLVGALHGRAERWGRATEYLRRAVQAALVQQDADWAYFVAQFFRVMEHHREERENQGSPGKAEARQEERRAWRRRIAGDFLDVFDLGAAIGMVQEKRLSSSPEKIFRTPRSPRYLLWTVTVALVAALVGGDYLLAAANAEWMQRWRTPVLLGLTIASILGTPLVLLAGSRRALFRLFPDLLYPRILGAIILAVITFSVTEQAAVAVSTGHPLLVGLMFGLFFGGGALYLFSEVRRKVGRWGESVARFWDIYCLACLEALSLSAVFVLIFEKLFLQSTKDPKITNLFVVNDIFWRPRTVLLIAGFSLFVGIVVHLMFRSQERAVSARYQTARRRHVESSELERSR